MDTVLCKILVDNEFWAILVIGDSTLLLRHVKVRFQQLRYFIRRDISLPSSHSNYILCPLLLHKRYLQGGYDTSLLVCVL